MTERAGHRVSRLARWWCAMFGHRIGFPRDIWAPLFCRRCDWTGPDLPDWKGIINGFQ